MKLKSKFISMFIAFALIPVIVAGIIIYETSHKDGIADAKVNLQNQQKFAKKSIENVMELIQKVGRQTAKKNILNEYMYSINLGQEDVFKGSKVKESFEDMMKDYGYQENIAILDIKGKCVVDGTGDLKSKDLSKVIYFMEVMKNKKTYISPVKSSIVTGNPIIVIAEPILDVTNQISGVLMQVVDLTKISEMYIDNIKIGDTGYIFIAVEDGTTIMHPNKEEILKKNLLKIDIGQNILDTKNGIDSYTYNGVEKLISYETDSKTGWTYIATIPIKELTKVSDSIVKIILIVIAIAVAATIVISLNMAKRLTKPIEAVSDVMDKVSKGDFTVGVQAKGNDEISQMSNSLNHTLGEVKGSIKGVKDSSSRVNEIGDTLAATSQELTAASNEVATAIQDIAQGSASQANELMEAVSLLANFNNELSDIKSKVRNVNNETKDAENKAEYGKEQIDALMMYIESIQVSFAATIEKINSLSESISKIGNITDVINDISEQTNLLALNANIEAARAGEAGRGFAVVAEEVRKLAEQTKDSSEEIIALVKSVGNEMGEVQLNSGNMKMLIDEEVTVANNTMVSFNDILGAVKSIQPLVDETNKAIEDVIKAKEVIENKVQSVSAVAEEVSASSEEINAASEEMNASAEELSGLAVQIDEEIAGLVEKVDKFKIE
ncbi:methyl-accepting chemotaxis protein [Clostridium ganghwense]|uniref:Methyl-accepting chemotaxis protein n=1 Tax=Clostridium ganghwense TaxID=312089 RepID=A0ABT4CPU1_9CLOT|nr:methyl-accepting chemotaxis protein [Clostridium ganghwense]MCY6370004.1 methyl-accepting chemotaxis protein [Clostridium ganghwense]